jgi:aminoglycoside/choline kinase family phosphotransferase
MAASQQASTRGKACAWGTESLAKALFVEFGLSMSTSHPTPASALSPQAAVAALGWSDAPRGQAFTDWLLAIAPAHGLNPASVRVASADASFRRYFRVEGTPGTFILMDAPPDKENAQPFVTIAKLMTDAGLLAPQVLAWDQPQGFMLLDDLGAHTMMQVLADAELPQRQALFLQAVDALVLWQQASKPGVLPPYDEALLRRELQLFPDWYVAQHKQITLSDAQQQSLHTVFDRLVAHNLASPQVFVHRDFMPRNLMVSDNPSEQRLGVLDFQDAVHGPITYDIASLMRDAFASWDEDFCLDITVRYWEKARALGLLNHQDWLTDFGAFYRAVEWMGLQRHLKVAGIFARLTLRDGKPKYLADTPRFIGYVRATASRYRELTPLLRLLDQIEGAHAVNGYAFGRV